MSETRIRFRTDNPHRADDAAQIARGVASTYYEPKELVGVEPARPGDTWRIHWRATIEQEAQGITEGPLAGYDICCVKCFRVHAWCQALYCQPRRVCSYTDETGVHTFTVCLHSGVGSCWTWTGSAEQGTLTASPSLHSLADKGGCGWHGFLQNGVLRG